MNLQDLFEYINSHKDEFKEYKNIKLSKPTQNYLQLSLLKSNKRPQPFKEIHYEIIKGKKKNEFIFWIHFEEYNTTRYKNNDKLKVLVEKNEFIFSSWWLGKKKKNNINNQSIKKRESFFISSESELKAFMDFLYNTFSIFNGILLEIYEQKIDSLEDKMIVVMTHNPNKEYGDVRPIIEKEGRYKNWKKSINVEKGQTVLIYISGSIQRIEYIMEVENVYPNSMDLKLVKKLSEDKANKLRLNQLQVNGFNNGTVNYILDNNKSLYDYVTSVLDMKVKKENYTQIKIKNIMLYGAPGVGKTHNYKRLISMIENGSDEKTIFNTISKNETTENFDDTIFEEIKKDKRIEFVTFHQSYSYEDFIEGFKPNENGEIELDKKGGVFKRISDKALENLKESQKENIQIKEEITFKQKLNNFIEKLEVEIEKKGYYQITNAAYITSIDSDAFRYNIRRENPTYKYDLRMKFEDLFEFEKNNVSSRQDIKKLETINSLANQHATYYFKVFDKIKEQTIKVHRSEINVNKEVQKNFYLVIDEINRGNISKIFGELITLIEEDKRDNYEVTLPYSKEKFKIPSNLYIIATMNSTDKSIATIDIALRRRFTFLKMKPQAKLVEETSTKEALELFNSLNDFITNKDNANLGEDYALGHSYFMNIKNKDDLEFIKEYKIKPLLEEYFYGDEENYNKAIDILKNKEETNG